MDQSSLESESLIFSRQGPSPCLSWRAARAAMRSPIDAHYLTVEWERNSNSMNNVPVASDERRDLKDKTVNTLSHNELLYMLNNLIPHAIQRLQIQIDPLIGDGDCQICVRMGHRATGDHYLCRKCDMLLRAPCLCIRTRRSSRTC